MYGTPGSIDRPWDMLRANCKLRNDFPALGSPRIISKPGFGKYPGTSHSHSGSFSLANAEAERTLVTMYPLVLDATLHPETNRKPA